MATATDLINRAILQLNDPRNARWSVSELLEYLNEGVAALVRKVPAAHAVVDTVQLVAGTKQTLPATAIALIRVLRAVGVNGAAGRAVSYFDLNTMNAANPGWHTATAGAVRQYSYDPAVPRTFWVYPPQPTPAEKADVEYGVIPPVLLPNAILPIGAEYHGLLVDYMLFRAYSKDSEYAGEDGRAAYHYKAFLEGTGAAA